QSQEVVNVSLDAFWHNLLKVTVEFLFELRRVDFKGPLPPGERFLAGHHNLQSPGNAALRIDSHLAAALYGVRSENLGWSNRPAWPVCALAQSLGVRMFP